MTEFLVAVTSASQIYQSRAKTIVLTAGQCTILVVVKGPTVEKITTALQTLYELLVAQGRYSPDNYLYKTKRIDKKIALEMLASESMHLESLQQVQEQWDGVPANAAVFYL